jgi:hypothetical protein
MTAREARDYFTGAVALPVAGLPLKPGFSDEDFQAFQNWLRARVDEPLFARHRSVLRLNSGDPAIVDAWQHCLNRTGGLSLIVTPVNMNLAKLTMEWWPTAESGHASPHVKAFELEGGFVAVGLVWKHRKHIDLGEREVRTVMLSRIPGQILHVTVRTDMGDEETWLGPVPVP